MAWAIIQKLTFETFVLILDLLQSTSRVLQF